MRRRSREECERVDRYLGRGSEDAATSASLLYMTTKNMFFLLCFFKNAFRS